jgi:glycosyltransferase involved in cell wall biosynthesis
MRILHVAPHYGGGIAPAVVGIIEATNASHVLVEIEQTRDSASLDLLSQVRVVPQNMRSLTRRSLGIDQVDFIIFHFWNSHLWSKLAGVEAVCLTRSSILLNHQAFAFNNALAASIGTLFDDRLQSGFIEVGLPEDWTLVPTCKSGGSAERVNFMREHKAIYIGTLDYKKISRDFFSIASQFSDANISVDIYGNLLDAVFTKDLEILQNRKIKYKGYALDKIPIFGTATYFLYPLRSSHYGTTENILLEAMAMGVIPLIKRNPVETHILGEDLVNSLDIDFFLPIQDCELFIDLEVRLEFSKMVRLRALELTDIELRESVWKSILNNNRVLKRCSLSELANQIALIAEKFPAANQPKAGLE